MTQTIKMQEGDKTPPLYNFYEDQYNFNDLSRAVDSGINDQISTLKYGKKYEREFREAVANIMSGVKDGTITFSNGRYNDALGRYSNDKNKNKDVYGWAANYVYNNMQNIPKYKQQTNTKKYNNTILGRELSNIIFGSDNGNLQYLWDVDTLDPETNQRGITGRLSVIQEAIPYIDVDTLLKDYTDKDRASVKSQLQQVTNALSNGQIDPGETLVLSKVFGGINWNNWLKTDFSQSSQQGKQQDDETQFYDYINTKHPLYNGELSSINLRKARYPALEENARVIVSKTDNELQQLDINKLDNDTKLVYLNTLISRNLLPTSDNLFILPNTLENETVLTFDPNTNTLARKRTHELSYYRKQWINDYNKQYGNPTDQLSQYFTEFKKNGGIIKAQGGTKLWYSGLSATGDYDPTKYTYSYDTSRLVNADMSDENWDPWISNVSGVGSGRYQPTSGNTREYTRSIEETPYYQQFRKDLLNPDETFTKVGLEWAKQTDKLLPKGSTATFFDENGELRKSWTVTNRDVYGRKPQTFNKLADYVNYVNYDQILGGRHNTFLNTGKRYFYKDKNGVEHWVDPNEVSKYTVSANPVRSQWNDDKTVYWNDYELIGLKPDQVVSDDQEEDTGSSVYPTSNQKSGSNSNNFLSRIAPDLLGAGRLFYSLRTNNKVADILNKALRPVLKDTYERYSPITGAFGEMQFRNRQAANLRRQASRPFTSDASLQLAGQLEADRQARDLEYQGFLADDKEIKRTQEAALARQEDNMARRSEVSNFNRASINQTNREKSQLEATRLRRNWQSADNFLQGIESRLRQSQQERKSLEQQIALSEAQEEYRRNLDLLDQKFKNAYPDATTDDMLNNTQYVDAVKRLRRRLQYDNNNILLNNYRVRSYQTPYTYPEILNRAIFAKKGGSLRPSIMSLISKVIDNENNS